MPAAAGSSRSNHLWDGAVWALIAYSLIAIALDLPLVPVVVAAVLFWLGSSRTVVAERCRRVRRWRDVSFMAGLSVIALALSSPIDQFSGQLFWVHMVQHVLLLTVAAPLIMLGQPWVRLWRALPLGFRRSLARAFMQRRWGIALRRAATALGQPLPSFIAFSGVLLIWHVPVLFDATLTSAPLHVLEHALFFTTALMFWKQVISSRPLKSQLSAVGRVGYLTAAMVVSWLLAVVLALAPHALYAPYADELSRPGGISALSDQQIAAGVMWVPGSIGFTIAFFFCFQAWLAPVGSPRLPAKQVGLATDH
ncbi:MAG: cytochrome c oxidase assembly protein [Actinomycetes bacterium]